MNKLQWKQYYREKRIAKKEEWRDIPWYEWRYKVSNLWSILSINFRLTWEQKLLKNNINKMGYAFVIFDKKNITIHKLVALTFIPNPSNKKTVNHKNWIKNDNREVNLEWATYSENQKHAYKTWLSKSWFTKNPPRPSKGKFWKDHFNSITVIQYSKNWELIKKWWWCHDAERWTWVANQSISKCCIWKRKTAWWFIWKYLPKTPIK